MKTRDFISFLLIIFVAGPVQAAGSDMSFKDLDPKVEKFIQQVVFYTYIETITDTTRHVMTSNNIQVMPQIVRSSIYHVGVEAYKNTDISEKVRQAYLDGLDAAHQAILNGVANPQTSIKKAVDEQIDQIPDMPIYRPLIEEVVRQAMIQQRAMMNQVIARQQMARIIARQQMLEQVIEQQFKNAYQQAINQKLQQSQIYSTQ